MRLAFTAALLSTVALSAQQSSSVPSSSADAATIAGRVVADETGDPVRNVRVTVAVTGVGTTLEIPVVLTDAEGRFSLSVPPGRHSVTAVKVGYAPTDAAPAGPGQPVEIRLRPSAVISGRVVDELGEPVLAARVTVEIASKNSNPTVVSTADTDDLGEYRLGALPAGRFVVALVTTTDTMVRETVGTGAISVRPGLQKTYYPGALTIGDAQEVAVQFGEDRSAIDFVVPVTQSGNQPFSVVRSMPTFAIARARQPDPAAAPMTGIIRGRILSTDGRGLSNAQVLLSPQSDRQASRVVRAGADGRFEFAELAAGAFRIGASKPGYFPVETRDFGVPADVSKGKLVDLADGETRERVEVSLARWGTLAGHVLDEYDDPVQSASVQLLQLRYEAGRRRLFPVGAARRTDDRGAYRLYGLAPGQYIVSAAIGDASTANVPGYARSYFPNTATPAEARFVAIGPGQDVVAIDLGLSRTRTVRVAGKVIDATGAETGGTLMLMPSQRSTSVTSVPVGARTLPNGSFVFANVPPGQYVIQAYRGRANGWTEGEFGALPVSVGDSDLKDLMVRLSNGSSITGRMSFDTADRLKEPARSAIELSPVPVDLDQSPQTNLASADIHADWTFEIKGISGPRRLQALRTPPGWALKEILVNGFDVIDRPLAFGRTDQSLTGVEIVLTDRVSVVTGTIRDDDARAVPGSHLIMFSTDRARWYPASRFVRTTVAGADGALALEGLPFGSYYAVAVTHLPADGADAWQDPSFLESLISQASSVTVRNGEQVSVNLKVKPDASIRRP